MKFPLDIRYPEGTESLFINQRTRRSLRFKLTRHARIGMMINELMTERKKLESEILGSIGDHAETIRIPDLNAFAVLPDKDAVWDEEALVASLGLDQEEVRGVMFWNEVEVTATFRFPGPTGLRKLMDKVREFVQKMNGTVNDDSIKKKLEVSDAQIRRHCAEHNIAYPYHARQTTKHISWRSRPGNHKGDSPS